jgi:hypothetical protein
MSWEQFYLICFGVGFVLSMVFAFSGAFHIHLPGKFAGHAHVGPAGHAHTHASVGKVGSCPDFTHAHVSPFNLFSIMAFLAWFGGTGYLLTHYSSFVVWIAFALSTLSGIVGASIVFYFLAKVMLANERVLSDADFEMVGVIGRVSGTIREAGIGEILFTQAGRNKSCGARSENGTPIPRATEIVVTRYERGVAYVRPWSEFAQEHGVDTQEGVQQ